MSYYSTADIASIFSNDDLADQIVYLFDKWNNQRNVWLEEKQELRSYVFATDTSHTLGEDGATPWRNKTTLPKLCQIRDNLHANYMSSLFPNEDWMKWEGSTESDEILEKKQAIQAYMANKIASGHMKSVVSQLLYDYIDYGIAIADVEWVNEVKIDPNTKEKIPSYVGPILVRKSPIDVVFDPTAVTFEQSPKITRSIIRLGELMKMQEDNPEEWVAEAITHINEVRQKVGHISQADLQKARAILIDGFGNLSEYYGSGYVEVLEFEGTFTDPKTGDLMDDYIVTVVDRETVVRKQPIPSWKRGGMKVMASWRKRPDNLYGMGPLDNLVGMQYRIDHLENAKADAWDLIITPAWKIKGGVEEFEFYPGAEIMMDDDGDINPVTYPKEALMVNNETAYLMSLMEEFAGAPRQAMGIRTPGEKTAFEVQSLENAAGRIFQQKSVQFEVELLEPCLNNMLMSAVYNLNGTDVVRVMDDDFGVATFLNITKEDIKASGKLRPVGARHFSERAQLMQNLTGIANTPIWAKIEKHVSDKALARMVEDSLQLQRFSLISDNAGLFEQANSQRIANTLQENVATEQATPISE